MIKHKAQKDIKRTCDYMEDTTMVLQEVYIVWSLFKINHFIQKLSFNIHNCLLLLFCIVFNSVHRCTFMLRFTQSFTTVSPCTHFVLHTMYTFLSVTHGVKQPVYTSGKNDTFYEKWPFFRKHGCISYFPKNRKFRLKSHV